MSLAVIARPSWTTASPVFTVRRLLGACVIGVGLLSLTACGGGQGDRPNSVLNPSAGNPTTPPAGNAQVAYTPGVFQPYKGLASQCARPRIGTNPGTGRAYPDLQGSVASENNWLRSWINDTYLWYYDAPDLDPNGYQTPAYFDLLKTSAVTVSGAPQDKFHFSYPTAEWEALSQSGVSVGYGVQWFIISARPPRQIMVAYVEPNSLAAMDGLMRGDKVVEIDGTDAISGNTQATVDVLNAALFPNSPSEQHKFRLEPIADPASAYTITLTSTFITSGPVQNVSVIPTTAGTVGYMLFNDHIATAESRARPGGQ